MKKTILLLFLTFFTNYFLAAQQAISETEKLASFGKVYGFLKYYHPEVAKGKFDWDKAFIEQLPAVLSAVDKRALSKVYLNWIKRLGEIKRCKKCDAKENYFDKNFDLTWTQDTTLFSHELASTLKFIEHNRNQGESFYVTTEPVGNIKLLNEPTYKDFEFPKEEYRLLGLIKYWNIVEYFYPYKYLTDQDWDAVLVEMIPKIRAASSKNEYQSAIKELVAKLDDTHAWINFSDQRPKYLPVKISCIENKAVVSGFYNDSIANINNLKLGDVILEVNGLAITTEAEKERRYIAGSNANMKAKYAYSKILHGIEDTVRLSVERAGLIKKINVNRYDFRDFNYRNNPKRIKSKSITESIGYIDITASFTAKEFEQIFDAFSTKKSIIIDLRGYPEGRYKMYTRFFNHEDKVFALKYSPDISYPGRFIFDKKLKTGSSRKAFNGKFILLVNENSLSLSEFTAMAFQTAKNIITVGNQTAGADGRNIVIEYLGGYTSRFSGYGIMYPDGTESQRKGVKIDVAIKPTINGLRNGRDEVLEKAIEIANE